VQNASILIVDDEKDYLVLLKKLLVEEGFIHVITEHNPLKVEKILQENEVSLILSDIYMPQLSGLELLERVKNEHPDIPVIMITAVSDIDLAVRATKLGAYEFITKPPETDRLFLTIRRALEQRLLELERNSLRTDNFDISRYSEFRDIITESALMYKTFELVKIFAPTDEIILLMGETGTGKDLYAKKIHQLSLRKDKNFVAVNLAAISSNLFESELFGHEKGAFTGAALERIGFFEAADGGTIFLDEIGELPEELQGKLLRTIQYGEIYKIGSTKPLKLNIRIIAATNKNLADAVNRREFRPDLFYRLNRGYIHLPPLRARGDDYKLLAQHFLEKGNRVYNKNIKGISKEVLNTLNHYSFPGNVRELENIILHGIAETVDKEFITEVKIPENLLSTDIAFKSDDVLKSIDEIVDSHIQLVINFTNGNTRKAANILGVSERTLQRKIKKIKEG
jgi:DNA-binding NtrC family response regulator